MIKNNCKYGGKEEKPKHKRQESRFAFKGPVVEEHVEKEGEVTPSKIYDNILKNENNDYLSEENFLDIKNDIIYNNDIIDTDSIKDSSENE